MDWVYMSGALFRDLWVNRLRRLLSVLGVIIGTGAVISSLAVIEGGRDQLFAYLSKLGTNIVFLQDLYEPQYEMRDAILQFAMPEAPEGGKGEGPGAGGGRPAGGPEARINMLTREDVDALARIFPQALRVEPQLQQREDVARPGSKPIRAPLEGGTPLGREIRDLSLAAGRYLCPIDLLERQCVCVLGAAVAERLFGAEPPLGQWITALGARWRVVGVLEPRGALLRFDYDDLVIVPLTSLQERTGLGIVTGVLMQARDAEAALDIRGRLVDEARAKLHRRDPEQFQVFCQDELIAQKRHTLRTFRILTVSIAAFSLLVSGIGIMNIMLVSVRERTRDIGVWKALGATDEDVLIYFLSESVLTCLIGGGLGVLLGVFLASQATGLIATTVSEIEEWVPAFRPLFFVLAIGAAVGCGLLAGLFPAYVAARQEPVEALRYE